MGGTALRRLKGQARKGWDRAEAQAQAGSRQQTVRQGVAGGSTAGARGSGHVTVFSLCREAFLSPPVGMTTILGHFLKLRDEI